MTTKSDKSPKSNGGYKYDKAVAIAGVKDTGGIMSTIAGRLEIDRTTVAKWLQDKDKQEFQEAVQSEKERVLDKAESNIVKAIDKGDPKMTTWFLNVKGQSRGYMQKQEVKVENMPVQTIPLDDDNTVDRKAKTSLKGIKC